jgi:putative aminopeptidase FrvX
MDDQTYEFLKHLIDTPSPSGYEEPAQAVAAERLREIGASLKVDAHGNLFGRMNEGGRPRVVLTGHVDQVGMIVRHITDEGLLHFETIGGVNPHALYGHRVDVHTRSGPVRGVIGRTLPHYQESDAQQKAMKPHEHWIDIGAASGEKAREAVRVGDPAIWVAPVERLGEGSITGAGIDDKVSVFCAIEALAQLAGDDQACPAEVVVVSAVQEEVTGVGAAVAAYAVDPDVAIAVDVWPMVSDVPGHDKKRYGEAKLGAGPIIMRGANASPIVVDLLCQAADGSDTPYQFAAWPRATPTDAASIFRAREGVPTAVIGIPQHYLHSPSEVVRLEDVDNTTRLLAAFTRSLKPDTDFTRSAAILGQ